MDTSFDKVPFNKRSNNRSKKKFIVTAVLIVLLASIGFAGYDYFWAKKYIFKTISTEEKAKREIVAVTKIIRQSIDLPPDEKAVMATVADIGQLKDQQFFRNAQNGDVVLMYPEFGKALIYRPKNKRVVEFGAMVIPPASPSQGGPASQTGAPKQGTQN